MNKIKTYIRQHWIWSIVMFFIILPLLLNIGLYFTDIIYNKYGFTLTASGLDNQDWLDLWGTYLSVVIAFVGICLAWKSSAEDRKMDTNEKLAQEYDKKLEEEKGILIEMCQSVNTDILYKTIIEFNNTDTSKCKSVLQNARERILDVQVKFELLSDIVDSFQKCEECNCNPCYDKENMIAIRDLYYNMEKTYLQILQDCEVYVSQMDQQQIIMKKIQIIQEKISLLQRSIFLSQTMKTSGSVNDIKGMEEEIIQCRDQIATLEKQKLNDEEVNGLLNPALEKINLISQEMKPQIINYCKSYIGWKNKHKGELLQNGKICYIKYPEHIEREDPKK